MSLLLDALKRAALEKQSKTPERGPATSNEVPVPKEPAEEQAVDEIDLEFELEHVQDDSLFETVEDWDGNEKNNGDSSERERKEAERSALEEAQKLELRRLEVERVAAEAAPLADEAKGSPEADNEDAFEEPLFAEIGGEEDDDEPTDYVQEDIAQAPVEAEEPADEVEPANEVEPVESEEAVVMEIGEIPAPNTHAGDGNIFGRRDDSLTQMIHDGHADNLRTRRRARFLYAMLVLTSLGSIAAYYFYLLGSHDGLSLRQEPPIAAEIIPVEEGLLDVTEVAPPVQEIVEEVVDEAADIVEEPTETVTSVWARGQEIEKDVVAEADTGQDYAMIVDNTVIAYEQEPVSRIDNATMAESAVGGDAERVMIYHKPVPTRLSDVVQSVYAAYQAGNFNEAYGFYQQALGLGPRNRDALLGAAATASQLGNYRQALRYYQHRLADDPGDSYAKAGLIALSQAETPDPAEIAEALADSPRAAHLHFLKAVMHVSEGDWGSAQESFFDAYHWDQSNPDYAYNLAVSLDHLKQFDQARQFYRKALDLNEKHPAQFSRDDLVKRLDVLGESQ